MTKKVFLSIILFSALAFFLFFFIYNQFVAKYPAQQARDISQATDAEIILILSKNQDAKDYMQKHKDFILQNKTVLSEESILAGQNAQNFREVYQGLSLEKNRYMRVDLGSPAANSGLIAVLDFKVGQVIKVYGIILLQPGSK
jgi:hypothetical protein